MEQEQTNLNNSNLSNSTIQNAPTFYEKIKEPKSKEIKEKLLEFIRTIQQKKHTLKNIPEIVKSKIAEIEKNFQDLWQEPAKIEAKNGEVIEAIITKGLYEILIDQYDNKLDNQIELNIKVFEFLELKHFDIDIDIQNHPSYNKAKQFIKDINNEKTPKDKLTLLSNACQEISQLLATLSNQITGADQFIPVFVYTLIQAQPQRPFSNLGFIRDFRQENRVQGSDQYYFTAFESALEFIEDINEKKLKINPVEFREKRQKYYKIHQADFKQKENEQKKQDKIKQITKEDLSISIRTHNLKKEPQLQNENDFINFQNCQDLCKEEISCIEKQKEYQACLQDQNNQKLEDCEQKLNDHQQLLECYQNEQNKNFELNIENEKKNLNEEEIQKQEKTNQVDTNSQTEKKEHLQEQEQQQKEDLKAEYIQQKHSSAQSTQYDAQNQQGHPQKQEGDNWFVSIFKGFWYILKGVFAFIWGILTFLFFTVLWWLLPGLIIAGIGYFLYKKYYA
ncbi:hypothetical protein PPERSA_03580 [Pseudocohnilembus persalinus]|uniref:VPS9 domain-containing protein n=1 Tax=Pseudocohnilembus persalinus TaxID=266149 RepID=A0A0V0QQ56_PSEPJ|nr:hypothetical protein PPERSA_03580 [Pseudocohnilembus persalinus]|eukprot:KRX04340.1 hypothetical protein PPERSA_03580 [Pseudocohnilembus persalinus]